MGTKYWAWIFVANVAFTYFRFAEHINPVHMIIDAMFASIFLLNLHFEGRQLKKKENE